jgi:hypothetical protein
MSFTTETPEPTLVSVASLRASHALTAQRVYELLAAGAIRSVQLGRRRFVLRASVDDYVARLADQPVSFGRTPQPASAREIERKARQNAKVVPLVPDLRNSAHLPDTSPADVDGIRWITQAGMRQWVPKVIAEQNRRRT